MPKLNFNFSKKKVLLVGLLFVLLLAIPLTVFLAQQQQQTQSHANPNTTLSLTPNPTTAAVGNQVKFDVLLSPGNNQVNFVKLVLKYDPTKLQADNNSFTLDSTSGLSITQGPTVGTGNITVTLLIQNDLTKAITTNTRIGTVTFDVIAASDNPTLVAFDTDQNTGVQIRSVSGTNNDAFGENVFLSGEPASVTIQGDANVSPSPSVSLTETPTLSPSATPSEEPSTTDTPEPTDANVSGDANQVPVCSALGVDPSPAVGDAPLDVTFSVSGSDADGTVDKITFNYGDGQVEDNTTGTGIGTDTIDSLTQTHTYQSSGSFTATAVLTDDANGTSDTANCTQTITVSSGGSASESATITPLPATGPNNTIVGLGAIGGILFMIGALLFLAL